MADLNSELKISADLQTKLNNLAKIYSDTNTSSLQKLKESTKYTDDILGKWREINIIKAKGIELSDDESAIYSVLNKSREVEYAVLQKIASSYGIQVDRIKAKYVGEMATLKVLEDQARKRKDEVALMDVLNVKAKIYESRINSFGKNIGGPALNIVQGGAVTSEGATGVAGQAQGYLFKQMSSIMGTLGAGAASLTSVMMLFGAGIAAVGLGALITNLKNLSQRLDSAQLTMGSVHTSGENMAQVAKDYVGTVGNAIAMHQLEATQVKSIAETVLTKLPESINDLVYGSDKAKISMDQIVKSARDLGISYEQSAKMQVDLTMNASRSLRGAAQHNQATEQYTKIISSANDMADSEVMAKSEYINQIQGAISATGEYETNTDDLSAIMKGFAATHSKSMPAIEGYGAAAANLVNTMRGMSDSSKVIFGGGLSGIWNASLNPLGMAGNMQKMLPGLFGQGAGASAESKSVGLMLAKGAFGMADPAARELVEIKDISARHTTETQKTRAEMEDVNKGFKDLYGNSKQMLNKLEQINRGIQVLATSIPGTL